jgi:hypothetical protein
MGSTARSACVMASSTVASLAERHARHHFACELVTHTEICVRGNGLVGEIVWISVFQHVGFL